MTFTKAEPTIDYEVRYVSASGRWQVGLHSMMFGVRVRLSETGRPTCWPDYCAGDDPDFQQELLRTVMLILLTVDEKASISEVEALFPQGRVKPIILDPVWKVLTEKAHSALSQVVAVTKGKGT